MFDRIIYVDWSGAGREDEGVDMRVAFFDAVTNQSWIEHRQYQNRTVISCFRQAFRAQIVDWLRDRPANPRCDGFRVRLAVGIRSSRVWGRRMAKDDWCNCGEIRGAEGECSGILGMN
jgi:hypothetical protein